MQQSPNARHATGPDGRKAQPSSGEAGAGRGLPRTAAFSQERPPWLTRGYALAGDRHRHGFRFSCLDRRSRSAAEVSASATQEKSSGLR